ncbi:MAG: hypothetical protein JNL47_12255 [Bacteroidia bacterium]|nr:hypothetical protein [Bacteroidia bacterium]
MSTNSETNKAMDAFKIKGDWKTQSSKLKTKFTQLTDSDLKMESGKDEELLKRLQNKLSKSREEMISIITKNQTEID